MNIPYLSFPKMSQMPKKAQYTSSFSFIGSCFSGRVGTRIKELNINSISNPFGIIFNSFSIYNLFEKIYSNSAFTPSDLVKNSDLYTSWLVGSHINSLSEESFLSFLNDKAARTTTQLKKSDYIFITLGTSFVYKLNETNEIVANCHKFPQKLFTKHLLTVEENYEALLNIVNLIKTENPTSTIIFTISPVRHIKDGIIENTISKSNIFAALDKVLKEQNDILYYPSYEIVIDCLRDYRFYEGDMVHPNDLALDLIFDDFSKTFFDEKGLEYIQDMQKLNNAANHKLLNPASESSKKFISSQLEFISQLEEKYPEKKLDDYRYHFCSLEE